MGEYRHNFKVIAKGRGPSPLNRSCRPGRHPHHCNRPLHPRVPVYREQGDRGQRTSSPLQGIKPGTHSVCPASGTPPRRGHRARVGRAPALPERRWLSPVWGCQPQEGATLHGVHPVCGGSDVHPATRTAWRRRVAANGQGSQAGRACAPTSPSRLPWSAGRVAQPGPVVAMASTGVDGQPVSPGLAGPGEGDMGTAPARRGRPGHKTAQRAAAWLAALWAPGLRRPSFVSPPERGAVREGTRPRGA